jgi:hypothetical protein
MKQFETNLGEKGEKGEIFFHCIYCDYKCYVKFSYERHLITSKHIKNSQMKQNETKKEKKEEKEKNVCDCGLVYYSRTSLWRHKKMCVVVNNDKLQRQSEGKKDELINYLIKENKEFKNLILEIVKKDTMNNCNNTTNNTNSHNKAFNLNFFLNETCKDAMNIMDFVDSIKLQLSDLEKVGEIGYVEGISNIIVKNLKELDVRQRPVHCTDQKRETMYIKDENKWEKDGARLKLHKVVRKVACKNQNLIPDYKKEHPDYNKYHSTSSDKYNKIIVESMGGSGDNDYEKEEKIIKNISKQVLIDKESN